MRHHLGGKHFHVSLRQVIRHGAEMQHGNQVLRAGLIDEISLAVCPAIDGARGGPHVFDSGDEMEGPTAPVQSMTLASSERCVIRAE